MLAAAAFAAALATGCASHAPSARVAATPRPPAAAQQPAAATHPSARAPAAAPASSASPPTAAPGYTGPHFDSPQAAMTYLAAAYNAGDLTALHHVTEPRAFSRLMSMRSDALNLRLRYCTPNPRGDFACYFRHDFPASEHKTGHGQAVFIAAPALNPGWYMYQFQSCD
jgi:predicted lipid-binding transport protein (Tim44 family)